MNSTLSLGVWYRDDEYENVVLKLKSIVKPNDGDLKIEIQFTVSKLQNDVEEFFYLGLDDGLTY